MNTQRLIFEKRKNKVGDQHFLPLETGRPVHVSSTDLWVNIFVSVSLFPKDDALRSKLLKNMLLVLWMCVLHLNLSIYLFITSWILHNLQQSAPYSKKQYHI